jgi:hypothetical protein
MLAFTVSAEHCLPLTVINSLLPSAAPLLGKLQFDITQIGDCAGAGYLLQMALQKLKCKLGVIDASVRAPWCSPHDQRNLQATRVNMRSDVFAWYLCAERGLPCGKLMGHGATCQY